MRSTVVTLLGLCAAAWGQPSGSASAPASQPATAPGEAAGVFKDIRIDPKAKQVVIRAEVCLRSGTLEFLLCQGETKAHESILRTAARPSGVHAALLAIGLTPGKPAEWSAPAEGQEPKFLPPRGPKLRVWLRWQDADGRPRQADAGDWLGGSDVRQAPAPKAWVFVGSQVLPDGRYWADVNGELVSVANFASSVVDVPFQSTDKDALLDFRARTDAIPKMGAAVEVVLEAVPGAEKDPDARALLEIDRFGRCVLDGRPTPPTNLAAWAKEYLARHARGRVVLRADARALAYDIERARQELGDGGIADIEEQRLPPPGEMLPRTPQQATQSLQWWDEQFASAADLIRDPGLDAETVLQQIDAQVRELEEMGALWTDYARQLGAAIQRYRASTQPATATAPSASLTPARP